MITIVHGSDIAQSRNYFQEERQRLKDSILFEADAVNLTDLAQVFDGGGLFGETKYLFIEQFITKLKKSSDFEELVKQLEKYSYEHTIIIWEGKELDRGALNIFKTATVKTFKLPQTLFQLLDSLQPGNGKLLIKLFHETIQASETEMVFFMLIRQVRILLALSSRSETQIDEAKRLAPWQKSKLERQASLFEKDQLVGLYNKLFKLETGQKTGTLSSSLVSTIDFLLVEV